MQIIPQPPTSVVATLIREMAPFYPEPLQREIEAAMPVLALEAIQLATEVMLAEQTGLPFHQAVVHPRHPRMEQAYFGLINVLQWRLPRPVQVAVRSMLRHGASGGLDPMRRQIFTIARRSDDPEAALCRYFLWLAVRLNLLVLTWDAPKIELMGALDEMDAKSETVFRELLETPGMEEPDVRPLNVLVAEMFLHMSASVKRKLRAAVEEYGAELAELGTDAEALGLVRDLGAKEAVKYWPGRFSGAPGSTQIARRYPQHFTNANALDQGRRRLRAKKPTSKRKPEDARLIDLVREIPGGAR
jgi:hypothetical protein